jgi:hypothetical protein
LEEFVEGKNNLLKLKERYASKQNKSTADIINLYKEYLKVNKKVERSKEELFASGTGKVFNSQFNKEKLKAGMKH